MDKMLLWDNKEELIELRLKEIKKNLDKNLNGLPKDELPFMEPHLRALYFQTYFLLAEGSYNASLVLGGIFLENITKERLFIQGIKDEELEEMNFGRTLQKCEEMKSLDKEEFDFLRNKKEKLRNPYAHYNKMKLSHGKEYYIWKIENPVDKLIRLQEKVNKGEITEAQARQELIKGKEPEIMTSKDFRPIAHMAKTQLEEDGLALSTFLEIDKFARVFAEKYFKPKEKQKDEI